ncbi:hypothetical protein T492DRAFT_891823, partial [Pavlovales sp. CCMP2436]
MGGAFGREGGKAGGLIRMTHALSKVLPVRSVSRAPFASSTFAAVDVLQAYAAKDKELRVEHMDMKALFESQERRIAELQSRLPKAQRASARLSLDAPTAPAQSQTSANAQLRAASAMPYVRGKSAADRACLAGVKRGDVVKLKPRAKYRGYVAADVYELGQKIKDGKVKLCDLKDPAKMDAFKIPYSSMKRYCKVDENDTPALLISRDVKRLTSLPKMGAGS